MNDTTTINPISVTISDARVVYAGIVLFESLDLTLPAGSWTSLLGPSGIGKSTLLRLIAGLGDGLVHGTVEPGDRRALAGRVAYMAQQDLLLPWLTVRDNVAFGSRLRRERIDRARIDGLLAAVGLTEKTETYPATLSGGERQRAALARTLYEDRPVVLMDEPFSALDALTRYRIQDLAARLLRDRTVLLVTHDPMEALRLSDTVWTMAGRPARLDRIETPAGNPPRALDAPDLNALQGALIARLANDRRAAA